LNFRCAFPSCSFRRNDIEEKEFLEHLNKEHHDEMLDISKKENMPIKALEMITVSNSTIFINYG